MHCARSRRLAATLRARSARRFQVSVPTGVSDHQPGSIPAAEALWRARSTHPVSMHGQRGSEWRGNSQLSSNAVTTMRVGFHGEGWSVAEVGSGGANATAIVFLALRRGALLTHPTVFAVG